MAWYEVTCPNGHTWETRGWYDTGTLQLQEERCPECGAEEHADVVATDAPEEW